MTIPIRFFQRSLQMPLQLIRRFSLRHRKHDKGEDVSRKGSSTSVSSVPLLPDHLLHRIVDHCEPLEQLRIRSVNRSICDHVNSNFEKYNSLDVEKASLEQVLSANYSLVGSFQLAVSFDKNCVKIVIDSRWTARDVAVLVSLLNVFRRRAVRVQIDAPIAELVVVSISTVNIDRWYTFQCYLKAVQTSDAHLECSCNSNPTEMYWPKLESLTIRTTSQQAQHLARVIDYGVNCKWMFPREMQQLVIMLTDEQSCRQVARDLYHFRCWAGSAGFDHRYSLVKSLVK